MESQAAKLFGEAHALYREACGALWQRQQLLERDAEAEATRQAIRDGGDGRRGAQGSSVLPGLRRRSAAAAAEASTDDGERGTAEPGAAEHGKEGGSSDAAGAADAAGEPKKSEGSKPPTDDSSAFDETLETLDSGAFLDWAALLRSRAVDLGLHVDAAEAPEPYHDAEQAAAAALAPAPPRPVAGWVQESMLKMAQRTLAERAEVEARATMARAAARAAAAQALAASPAATLGLVGAPERPAHSSTPQRQIHRSIRGTPRWRAGGGGGGAASPLHTPASTAKSGWDARSPARAEREWASRSVGARSNAGAAAAAGEW